MSVHTEIQAVLAAYGLAYRQGDARGCASVYTEDAQIHSPYGPPARGRAAIEALHAKWLEEDTDSKRLLIVEFGVSGDLAWCLAAYSEGGEAADGTSLNILERGPDGAWRIRMTSLNEIA